MPCGAQTAGRKKVQLARHKLLIVLFALVFVPGPGQAFAQTIDLVGRWRSIGRVPGNGATFMSTYGFASDGTAQYEMALSAAMPDGTGAGITSSLWDANQFGQLNS